METIEELVTAAQGGEREAFGEIVRRFQGMACAGAYAVVGDAQLAEDVAQEAFMEAFSNLAKLREAAAFPGWFRRILFKQGDRVIRGKRVAMVPIENTFEVPVMELNPALVVEKSELSERVWLAVNLLPEHERITTILFYSTGYALKEIAAFLEVPVTTVKKRLYTARQRLKEDLREEARESFSEYQVGDAAHFPERVRLLIAARAGDMAEVKELLNRQPLLIHRCAERGDRAGQRYTLIMPGYTALHEAAARGHTALVDLLLDYGAKINAVTSSGMTPLHIATLFAAQDVVKLLLERGANANTMFANGHTALHWAAIKGDVGCSELLLRYGANVEARSAAGRTPLHWAALKGHRGVAELLLNCGADGDARDELGRTPLDWARERG